MTPNKAYNYAYINHMNPGFDLKYYQEIACKHPQEAYFFAKDIPGADIKYCQKHACKDPWFAYKFARDIICSDVIYCQKYACKKPYSAYWFAKEIPGADMESCRKAFKNNQKWLNKFNKMIICKVMS